MVRVGLTGGIASGKSFVADELQARGAVLIDSDLLAREVVQPGTPGLAAVVERFGEDILTPEGMLDRPRLGRLVFADDAARADLNAIVHPLVRARSAELEQKAPVDAVVVHVIPLLVETGQQDLFDEVVVVDVPVNTQVLRLMHRNNLSRDEACQRIMAQASRVERCAAATHVIDNDGDQASTVRQVEQLWEKLSNSAT
ncbi:dephospho-CoA kinase [Tessaracoccus sp. MC1865]|uniref:dephospho-CoA kinase n=1 Tax=Tessaracoccus sp. MC1865 TaxID=2760310 RepID=UPI0016046E37|nr:dephospho-CoA kinase [Tessaracoccus sp. MC1865]MBB1483578.1 dephospho-CoA kinase [Tessaracoccus sp. MC1865]QTO36662.1 dephospho-CoA kinase [Tessaracoccus sp. MC1865]